MSTPSRRRHVQRLGLAGIGSAVLLVAIASPAVAAPDVVIPLEPSEVGLSAVPAEYLTTMGEMSGSMSGSMSASMSAAMSATALEPETAVDVRFSGTLVIDLPPEFDTTDVGADLVFDDNQDGTPEATYSSDFAPGNSRALTLTGQGTDSLTLTLPADDPTITENALLLLEPLGTTLGPEFLADGAFYELEFTASAPATRTVEPVLAAYATYPCDLGTWEPCPFPTPVTPGATVGLDLTADSLLREVGFADLSGLEVGLVAADTDGFPTGEDVVTPPVQVEGSTASFVLPEDAAAGQYALFVLLESPAGRVASVQVLLTVAAPQAPVAPPTAEPTTAAPPTQAVVNAGLRSNTGVVAAAPADDTTGTTAVAAGAGLLLVAGGSGVAVARRRRPATGTGGA
jgi:hypothetical protein